MPHSLSTAEELAAWLARAPLGCVHFAAEWCPPSKELNAALDEIQSEFSTVSFAVVDAEQVAETAEKLGVESVPHVVFFKDGQKHGEVSGAKLPEIRAALRALSGTEGDVTRPLDERLKELVSRSPVMLFMKGTPSAPRCGFSKQAIALLDATKVPYDYFDILTNDEVRQGLKEFSNWPTYPQLYAKGELVGGLDVMKELQESGELTSTLQGE
eukprot:EG_transcript_18669